MKEIKKLKCLKKQIKTKVVKNAAKGNRINKSSICTKSLDGKSLERDSF